MNKLFKMIENSFKKWVYTGAMAWTYPKAERRELRRSLRALTLNFEEITDNATTMQETTNPLSNVVSILDAGKMTNINFVDCNGDIVEPEA